MASDVSGWNTAKNIVWVHYKEFQPVLQGCSVCSQ